MELQATFDQLPLGIAHSDQAGRIFSFNATFCAMLGLNPEELAGKTFAQITYANDIDKSSAELERLWRGEIPFYILEKRYIRKSGEITWIRVTAALVRHRNGAIESAVGILEDISARRLVEEQLARLHQETLAASCQAGKAEVAADVLHHLGNALNSVNVSASILGVSPQRIAALVQEHAQDLGQFATQDERGRQLPAHLSGLAEQLLIQQRDAQSEFASLRDSLQQVNEMVTTQQRHVRPRSRTNEGDPP